MTKRRRSRKRNDCFIDSRYSVPRLRKQCKGQKNVHGSKCYKNRCKSVTRVLSSDSNVYGNVVLIKDGKKSIVVKWNRYSEELENMIMELKMQNIAHSLKLAPKILDAYKDGKKLFIIMENLLSKGYDTIHNIFKRTKIPKEVLLLISKGLCKLHKAGISHGDLHPLNVFYNPKKHKIMFIDFGFAQRHSSPMKARKEEKFDFTNIKTPKTWKDIAIYEKSFCKK